MALSLHFEEKWGLPHEIQLTLNDFKYRFLKLGIGDAFAIMAKFEIEARG